MPTLDEDPFTQLPAGFNAGEPTDPTEIKRREDGWAQLQATLSEPNMRLSLMRMGLQMMQPVPVGQTGVGHTAQAALSSMDYLQYLKQQELQNKQRQQQIDSTVDVQGARAERERAETRDLLPAQVAEQKSSTKRREALLPVELDTKAKELALLDLQIKDAPNESERKRLMLRREAVGLELDEKYGGADKQASIGLKQAQAGYYGALSRAQKGLEKEREAKALKASKIKWKTQSIDRDEENPYRFVVVDFSDDGEKRITTVDNGMPAAEARARARQEIKAYSKEQIQARFPGMTAQKAETVLMNKFMQGAHDVVFFNAQGVPRTAEESTGKPPSQGLDAPKLDARPLPAAMQTWADGDGVPDKDGRWWVKRGNQLVPATGDDMKRIAAQKGKPTNYAAGAITPAPVLSGAQ